MKQQSHLSVLWKTVSPRFQIFQQYLNLTPHPLAAFPTEKPLKTIATSKKTHTNAKFNYELGADLGLNSPKAGGFSSRGAFSWGNFRQRSLEMKNPGNFVD